MTDSNPEFHFSNRNGDESSVSMKRRTPNRVFSLLGDETRVRILQTLGETPAEDVSFAELQRRANIHDSGQFNYHLNQLRGTFVRKTPDGYRLSQAGRQIIGAMHAGTYTVNATIDTIPVEGACLVCGSDLTASYADETATVECTGCEEWRVELPFPPGSLEQFDLHELPKAFDAWMRHVIGGIISGFCATCAGRTAGSLVRTNSTASDIEEPVVAEYVCERCGSMTRTSPTVPALFHPAIEGFLYDHGIDLNVQPTWGLEDVLRPDMTTDERDPIALTIRFNTADTCMAVRMDEEAQITGVERRPATE